MKRSAIAGLVYIGMMVIGAQPAVAAEIIDQSGISDFLASEKKQMEAKDTDGLLALFSDDYTQTSLRGGPETKEQIRLKLYNAFNAAKYVLFKPKIISTEISADGKTATVITDEITKYLIERDGKQRVVSYHTAVKSVLVLVDGEIRARSTETLRNLE